MTDSPRDPAALERRIRELEATLNVFRQLERDREEQRLAAEEAEADAGVLFRAQQIAEGMTNAALRPLETRIASLESALEAFKQRERQREELRLAQAEAAQAQQVQAVAGARQATLTGRVRSLYHRVVPLERRLAFRDWRRGLLRPSAQRRPQAVQPTAYIAPAGAPVRLEKPEKRSAPKTAAGGHPDMFIFSIIEYSARFQRPQQLAVHLARAGHRVFYVSSAQFLDQGAPAWDARPVADNVWEVRLNLSGAQPGIYDTLMADAQVTAAQRALDGLRAAFQVHSAASIVHLPFWTPLALSLRRAWGWRLVYDCMDEWEGFPLISPAILEGEKILVQESDLVTVTGSVLYQKWQGQARRCLLVRNGVDYAFFAHGTVYNDLLDDMTHPIAGYYGALAEWVDFPLLRWLAEQRPHVQFVLLGDSFTDTSQIQGLPNVHLLGRQPYEHMPAYLFHFDVCLIPFRIYSVTHAVDPVKFYEYLSAGKPVVSAHLHELDIYSEYLYLADSHEAFLAGLDTALAERDTGLRRRRMALASQNQWSARVEDLRAGIRDIYPRVSILIVTHNNVALTRACVESVLENTAWPNIELVLVDNASSDSTPTYLSMLEAAHPQVRVILNADNRGFAAANNQALSAATGERLVLLNNDTVVPPGWLEGLMRWLDDPAVGLVGPVSNFVGNEARIPVTYRTAEAMPDFARRYMTEHAGESFEIGMLAMFCIAMRRDVYERIGPLDETFGIGMFEDDDYSERARQAGLRIVCARDVFVHHVGQAAFKKLLRDGTYDALWARNQAYFEQKWGRPWAQTRKE